MGRGKASPPRRLLNFVTALRALTPDCPALLQEVLIDVGLVCTFHLDQTNSAFHDAEDCVVNVDIGSRHFHLKFCHGRTTRRHHGGLDILQVHLGLTKGLTLNRTLRY